MAEARELVRLLEQRDDLEVAGITTAKDEMRIGAFRLETGAGYPILMGFDPAALAAYDVKVYPQVLLLARDGRVAGRGLPALRAALK